MNRIVERCPSCGVEHDHRVHECEACGSAVRHWCRMHSREIGWLEGAACIRCDEEEARRSPRRRRSTAPPPPPPAAPVAPIARDEVPAVHPGKPREWADAPEGPRSPVTAVFRARLKEAIEKPPPAAPPVAMPSAGVAHVPAAPVEPVRRRKADAAPGRGLLVRLYESLLTVMMTGIVGVPLGVVIAGVRAYRLGGEIPLEAANGGVLGGLAGLVLGVLIATLLFPRTNAPRS
ncbi:MAG TPA: hypothetical protein VF006_23485 [Longimicrobium sp.]